MTRLAESDRSEEAVVSANAAAGRPADAEIKETPLEALASICSVLVVGLFIMERKVLTRDFGPLTHKMFSLSFYRCSRTVKLTEILMTNCQLTQQAWLLFSRYFKSNWREHTSFCFLTLTIGPGYILGNRNKGRAVFSWPLQLCLPLEG